jgi:hypothetical protein
VVLALTLIGVATARWVHRFIFRYNLGMLPRCGFERMAGLAVLAMIFTGLAVAQSAPSPSAARILILPRRIVSGDHATLAVLDVNGRLTPGVRVSFSNGDHLTTDATGRALFVAPLNPGVISAAISGHPGHAHTTILNPEEAGSSSTLEVSLAPRIASINDRFELAGHGFCGDADANRVSIAGQTALVLASSPTSLVVLPPAELESGTAEVQVACGKREGTPFSVKFVSLTLVADSSPLAPGDHRTLKVRVRGTTSKVELEAHNLAPDIAELSGGNPARVSSSGGGDNAAQFQLVGRQRGSFVVSIRLMPTQNTPRP